jgi:glycine cleavage system transcriptional repressor
VGEFAVTAIGRDRPGIVASISRVLYELDGNIADSQMSILRGHFAVMLIVDLPEAVPPIELQGRLGEVREELGLEAVAVNEVASVAAAGERATHVLTVYGADHPGIVHTVSSTLAGLGVNINDLETRVAGSDEAPVYVMIMELSLGEASEGQVEAALRKAGSEARVEVSLHPLEAEAL